MLHKYNVLEQYSGNISLTQIIAMMFTRFCLQSGTQKHI